MLRLGRGAGADQHSCRLTTERQSTQT